MNILTATCTGEKNAVTFNYFMSDVRLSVT